MADEDLNEQVRAIWNHNAPWWDEQTGEGNTFQRRLIGPATERLLELKPGETVLDCACGNGAFARRLAGLGAKVVAFDFSERFLELARQRTVEDVDRIKYRLLDATNEEQLLALGRRRFDAAVCTMALMDMAAVDPLFSALSQVLKPGGRFVFSVLHPCFNSASGVRLVVEREDRGGVFVTTHSVQLTHYLRPTASRGLGIVGQPMPHIYFHRPLGLLFGAGFRAGFMLDGLEEPAFSIADGSERPFTWESFKEIPPVLAARLRLP